MRKNEIFLLNLAAGILMIAGICLTCLLLGFLEKVLSTVNPVVLIILLVFVFYKVLIKSIKK